MKMLSIFDCQLFEGCGFLVTVLGSILLPILFCIFLSILAYTLLIVLGFIWRTCFKLLLRVRQTVLLHKPYHAKVHIPRAVVVRCLPWSKLARRTNGNFNSEKRTVTQLEPETEWLQNFLSVVFWLTFWCYESIYKKEIKTTKHKRHVKLWCTVRI